MFMTESDREEVRARIDSLPAPLQFRQALMRCLTRIEHGPIEALMEGTRSKEWGTQGRDVQATAPTTDLEARDQLYAYATAIERAHPELSEPQAVQQAINEHPELMAILYGPRPAGRGR